MTQYDCPVFRPHDGEGGLCVGCGTKLTGRRTRWCSRDCERTWQENHDWGMARAAAKRRDGQRCVHAGCEVRHGLEVNHIAPRNGGGYGWGCWNHLDNLETLCHQHHLEVTRQQAEDRARLYRRMDQKQRDDRMGQDVLPLGSVTA